MWNLITIALLLVTCAVLLSTGWSSFVQVTCTNVLAVTNVKGQASAGGRLPISDYCLMVSHPQSQSIPLTRQRVLYLWRRDGVEAALPILQAEVDRGVNDLSFFIYLGLARIETNQLVAAIDILSRLPHAGRLLDNLGRQQLAREEWDKAVRTYWVATHVEPSLLVVWKGLGRAYRGQGDIQHAALAYQRAVAIAADDPDPYYELGQVLEALGNYGAASSAYENAVRLEPRRAHYYYSLGVAYLQLSNYRAAASAFEKAVSMKPGDSNKWFLYHYGWALENLGQFCDAAYQYQRALRVDSTYQVPANRLLDLRARGVLNGCMQLLPTTD